MIGKIGENMKKSFSTCYFYSSIFADKINILQLVDLKFVLDDIKKEF